MGADAKTVLVVDDETDIRGVLTAFLTGQSYEALEANDGDHALEVLAANHVDLIIADVEMPTRDGLSMLAEIKQTQPDLPVIMISGMPSVGAAVECLKNGAVDYITKPFDLKTLAQVVRQALEGTAAPAPNTEATQTLEIAKQKTRRVGKYTIQRVLGEGNMGSVYLVHKDGEDPPRDYALKLLKPHWLTEEEHQVAVQRFMREAEASSSARHPHIVKIVEYGVSDDEELPYLVMEFLQGRPLRWFISQKKAIEPRQKAKVICQVADALAAIHALGICHRDVKPGNIVLDEELNAKLTDFGIARMPDSSLTLTLNLMGSPAYLAPEGFVTSKVDARADIFSLGVVAYEFFLGCKPFQAGSIPALAMKIRSEAPVEPRKIEPKFPLQLQDVLARMLKKDPGSRYQTAAELRDQLQGLLDMDDWRTSVFRNLLPDFTGSDWQ